MLIFCGRIKEKWGLFWDEINALNPGLLLFLWLRDPMDWAVCPPTSVALRCQHLHHHIRNQHNFKRRHWVSFVVHVNSWKQNSSKEVRSSLTPPAFGYELFIDTTTTTTTSSCCLHSALFLAFLVHWAKLALHLLMLSTLLWRCVLLFSFLQSCPQVEPSIKF